MSGYYLQALVVEAEERQEGRGEASTFYEITIASVDQPKLLCRLSESLVRQSEDTSHNLRAFMSLIAQSLVCVLGWALQIVLVSLLGGHPLH